MSKESGEKGLKSQVAALVMATILMSAGGPAMAVTPESKEHTKKGIALFNAGKGKEAIEEFKKAIALDPKNADYHRNLGQVYQTQEMMPDAQKEAEAAVKFKGSDVKNVELLATLLFVQKKYAEAEKVYRQAMKLNPKSSEFHTKLTQCLKAQGKNSEFESEVNDALKKNPKDVKALILKSKSLLDQNKKDEAEKAAADAVSYEPQNAYTHFALANILKARGKDKKAIDEFKTALKFKPDAATVKDINDAILYINNKVDSRIP